MGATQSFLDYNYSSDTEKNNNLVYKDEVQRLFTQIKCLVEDNKNANETIGELRRLLSLNEEKIHDIEGKYRELNKKYQGLENQCEYMQEKLHNFDESEKEALSPFKLN